MSTGREKLLGWRRKPQKDSFSDTFLSELVGIRYDKRIDNGMGSKQPRNSFLERLLECFGVW